MKIESGELIKDLLKLKDEAKGKNDDIGKGFVNGVMASVAMVKLYEDIEGRNMANEYFLRGRKR